MSQPAETPYDRTPYGHYTHPQTHPARLFAVGRLFGMAPADPRRARVLELGCASGGNLIPMAFGLPEATFIGIDLSGEQIGEAKRQRDDLGLANLDLRHASIEDVDESFGEFDYIICHGVYSWVPDRVREKILAIFSDRLTADGVAHVSYNALPGWHLVNAVRDMMRFHVAPFDDPEERAAQARAFLKFTTSSWEGEESPYADLLRAELELLSGVPDSYLIHDHLEEANRPIYFHELVSAARTRGLDYLADGDLATMLVENLASPIAEKLREVGDIVRQEQYMDFLRGRRFRNTLLCRGEVRLDRNLDLDSLRPFFISSRCTSNTDFKLAAGFSKDAGHVLAPHHLESGVKLEFNLGNTRLNLGSRVGKAAMMVLLAEAGRPISFADWIERTAAKAERQPADIVARLEDELDPCRLLFANAIEISSLPPAYVSDGGDRPAVTPLVRYQAEQGVPAVNQRHEPVALGPAERALLACLDGSRSRRDIVRHLSDRIEAGDLNLTLDGEAPDSAEARREAVEAYCDAAIERLAAEALLVG